MKLFKCMKCGELVEVLEEKCDSLTCCGELMKELIPGSVDAAAEKHVPFCEIQGDYLSVKIGEVEHPMSDDHYIVWIAAEYKDSVCKFFYKPGDKPEALFDYEKGMVVYAYCNLHGIWKKEM